MNRPLYTVECEDCGKFAVMNTASLTVYIIDKEFSAITRCLFCDRLVTNIVSKEVAVHLFWDNVKIFNFNTGEQILDQKILEKM